MADPARLLGNPAGAATWRSRALGARRAIAAGLIGELSLASSHWNVMSRHLEMSEPRPEEMMMQPRTFCALTSAAQTE